MAIKKDKNMTLCRICNKDAEIVVSFGRMPIANNFLKENDDFSKEYFFDLAALFCITCKAFQLADHPTPEQMFHDEYAFFSGTSKKMAEHFQIMAESYIQHFITDPQKTFVVELGSNDGIMLKHFAQKNIQHLGVEPSQNVARVAQEQGVATKVVFFGEQTAVEILEEHGQADIICAANVMNHIPDLSDVARGVALLLKKDGVLVFEDPYAGDVVQKVSYDQFYDEHIYMFSVESVRTIFEPHGFELFRVEPQSTHGGSMRYYLDFKGTRPVENSVFDQVEKERSLGLDRLETYYAFGKACQKKRDDLRILLQQLKRDGKRVVGYAATAKSTTILNYCDIGADLIEYIGDTTPLKQNTFSPGMHIPVKSYEQLKNDIPDYMILFAWNHAQEIFEKEEDFVKNGGKWIILSPQVKVFSKE